MKKSILLFLLSLTCVTSFALGSVACGEETPSSSSSTGGNSSDGENSSQGPGGELVVPEEPEGLTDPDLKSITVYKADAPEGFYVGKGTLTSLTVDGVALGADAYIVSGGWLVLTAKSWEELGSGELSFVFDFENYDDVTLTVTVSDTDETPAVPGSELLSKENFELWTANSSTVELSYEETESAIVVTKTADTDSMKAKENMVYVNADYIRLAQENGATCIRFEYKANETLAVGENAGFRFYATETVTSLTGGFDSFTATTEWQTATLDIEQFFVANGNAQYLGLVVGGKKNASLTVKNWRVGTREELNEYRVSTLLPNYGFSEENVSKWALANNAGLQIGWKDGMGMSLTPQKTGAGLWQRDGVAYTPVTFMRIAQSAGYQGISFTVKADDDFADYIPPTAGYKIPLGKGIRVVSKTIDGRDDNWIIDGYATGIRQYGDFGADGSLEFTVTIALDAFFALNEDAKYLGVVVASDAGSSLYLSDLKLIQTIEGGGSAPEPDGPDAELVAKYGFSQENTASTANGGIWDVNYGGYFSKTWDPTANAMKITMAHDRAGFNARDFVTYTSLSILKEAKEAGFKGMNFKVTSSDGAFLDGTRGIRVYSKTTAGRDGDAGGTVDNATYGTYVYGDFGTKADTTEFTVTIDIEEFLALNESANYFAIVLNLPNQTSAYFSDLSFLETVEKDEDGETGTEETSLNEKYAFSATTSYSTASGGIWDVNAGGTTAKSWDASANAMKIVMANANSGLNGRDFVTYTDISILKEAQAAGFTTMTFKVSSPDGAFAESERTVGTATVQNGIRVFSKKTPGRDGDGGRVEDTELAKSFGTYVYKDFGTGGGITEFTVTIDIEEFLALNAEANYFAFVLSTPNGTTAYFSDLQFLKEV